MTDSLKVGYIVIEVVKTREVLGVECVQLKVEIQDLSRGVIHDVELQEVLVPGRLTLELPK